MARLAAINNAVRTLDESVNRAREAERLGYESVWVTQLPELLMQSDPIWVLA